MTAQHSGMIGIVGRPNVGKSTLLNRLVGAKISITSRRPQTTRHRILGIETSDEGQVIYVDTPGLHADRHTALNQYLERIARASLPDVDAVLFVVSAEGWTVEDDYAATLVRALGVPAILVINKMDRLKRRQDLLPLIDIYAGKGNFADIVPVSARRGTSVDELRRVLRRYLPEQPPIYPVDQLTDRSLRFLSGERVREQIFRTLGQELPYASAVEVSEFKETNKLIRIEAIVWVEKEGQKAILIGKRGERLKVIGERARKAIEELAGKRVHLKTWVKVRRNWSDDQRMLTDLGYGEDS